MAIRDKFINVRFTEEEYVNLITLMVYVVTEKCTRFSLKSVPLERRIKGSKSLLFLS